MTALEAIAYSRLLLLLVTISGTHPHHRHTIELSLELAIAELDSRGLPLQPSRLFCAQAKSVICLVEAAIDELASDSISTGSVQHVRMEYYYSRLSENCALTTASGSLFFMFRNPEVGRIVDHGIEGFIGWVSSLGGLWTLELLLYCGVLAMLIGGCGWPE